MQVFLATYRCLPHPNLDWRSPAEVLHGRQPRNMLTLMNPVEKRVSTHRDETPISSSQFTVDSLVYARNYSYGPKWLPGKVVCKLGSVLFWVRTDRGVWKRHINQLQPKIDTQAKQKPLFPEVPTDAPADTQPQSHRYPRRDRQKPDY